MNPTNPTNQILKLVIPYLDFPNLCKCRGVCKGWYNLFDPYLKKHHDVLAKWSKTENSLFQNKQLESTDEFFINDCCFIQETGLCLNAIIIDKKFIKINLATFYKQIKTFQVEIPSDSKPYKYFYYFDIYWKPSIRVAILDIDKYFFRLDLSNLEQINHDFIKKSPKTRQMTATFNSWFKNGKYNAFDQNGKKLLTIKKNNRSSNGITLKYKSQKEINVKIRLVQQILSFGDNHQYIFIRGHSNIIFINANTKVQQSIDSGLSEITSFFWKPETSCFSIITQKKNLVTFKLKDEKWEQRSTEKIQGCFGQFSDKQQKVIFFEPQLKKIDGYSIDEWIKQTKPHHLRIKDIMNLQIGQKLEVYHLDRNLIDCVENDSGLKPHITYPPERFLENSVATYTHNNELNGNIFFPEINQDMEFEFHIEFNKNHWYPLTNGRLPLTDDQGFSDFGEKSGWHWSQFPLDTRIGWRGPMIVTSKIKMLPKVYYENNDPTLLI